MTFINSLVKEPAPSQMNVDEEKRIEEDPLYEPAVGIVVKSRRASISLVQRHLRIGYDRAARLVERMEHNGVVTPMQSDGNREVIWHAVDTNEDEESATHSESEGYICFTKVTNDHTTFYGIVFPSQANNSMCYIKMTIGRAIFYGIMIMIGIAALVYFL